MNRPRWRIRTSWAGGGLITAFRYTDTHHGVGGYAAIKSFHSMPEACNYVRTEDNP